jgi:hypothetical protein
VREERKSGSESGDVDVKSVVSVTEITMIGSIEFLVHFPWLSLEILVKMKWIEL